MLGEELPRRALLKGGRLDVDQAPQECNRIPLFYSVHDSAYPTAFSNAPSYNKGVGTSGIRSIEGLRGPAGHLEALLNASEGAGDAAFSVLLCHPHPLFGGTMHNKVVYRAMKTFTGLGLPVLRFNFRGTGRSEGVHDAGAGEQDDARAGLQWLAREFALPIVAAGFSFGAHMALRAGCPDPRVAALVSLGTPIQAADRQYSYGFLAECRKPKLFLSGACDPFGPIPALETALEDVPEPKELAWIAEADHFFSGHLPAMQSSLEAWLLAYFPALRGLAEQSR